MLRITDATNFRRTAAGLCLLAGPLLILLGDLISPATPDGAREYLAFVAEHQTVGIVSTFLFFSGLVLLVPGVLGSLTPIRGRGVVLAHVAAILATVGLMAFAALVTTSLYDVELAKSPDRAAAAAVYEGVEDGPAAWALFLPGFLGTALGLVLFAAAYWRARLVAPWVPLLVLGGFVTIMAAPNEAVSVAGNAVLVAGLAAIGLRVLRTTDLEWAAPSAIAAETTSRGATSREAVA
ncbi:MAG: hypothetical protein ICV64_00115 [Thermoleophilia bacterium]|nr:hypothetical protein [Thermoleophilia bacterium]